MRQFISNNYTKLPSRKFWLMQLFFIFLGALFMLFSCTVCLESSRVFWRAVLVSSSMWVVLANGNYYATEVLDEFMSWHGNYIKKFIIGIVMTCILSPLLYYGVARFWEWQMNISILGKDVWDNIVFSIFISIAISGVLHGRGFLFAWRKAAVLSEQLQREKVQSDYETLKNQVNPHFLFNNLNVLTNLIHLDQDRAVTFVKQMSNVYRYVLENRKVDLILLEEELTFLKAYFFLLETRFRKGFSFVNEVKHPENIQIPPLVIQMLIENAVKHNIVSEETPLEISIAEEEKYLVVQNKLQKKQLMPSEYTGLGLENIKARYAHFSEVPMKIEQTDAFFTVYLPKITP